MGSALQPPFRNVLVAIVKSDPATSARRMRLMARVYFVIAGIFVATGIVESVVARRFSFLNAYPFVMGVLMVLNGFTFLRTARKTEAGVNALRSIDLPSLR